MRLPTHRGVFGGVRPWDSLKSARSLLAHTFEFSGESILAEWCRSRIRMEV